MVVDFLFVAKCRAALATCMCEDNGCSQQRQLLHLQAWLLALKEGGTEK